MRNLKLVHDSLKYVGDDSITSIAWDSSSDSLVYTTGPTRDNAAVSLRRISATVAGLEDKSEVIAAWDALCPLPDLEADKILDHHYFVHNTTSCIIFAGGDIVIVRHTPLEGEERIEIVGSVDDGITQAAWSPDEELLVLTTRANTFLFMTADFDNVADIKFSNEDVKISKHVSVGWGKKETQFQGKRAKALRDPTMPEKVDEGVLVETDDGCTTISWRGDGAYVAVNAIIDVDGKLRRVIRVYSREGVLDSVSEPVDRLTGALSWRPAGNLITGVQLVSDNEANVVFFERNGLRHGQFGLKSVDPRHGHAISTIELAWNVDSSVLAVAVGDYVQLWTMSNYHYYLKQILQRTVPNESISSKSMSICWHPEESLRLATTVREVISDTDSLPKEFLRSTTFVSAVCTGSTVNNFDYGTTVVIDGDILKVTPLRKANIPPPMALHDIQVQENSQIRDVAVNRSSSKIAALARDAIFIVDFDVKDISSALNLNKLIILPAEVAQWSRQICFSGDDEVLILFTEVSCTYDAVYNIATRKTFEFSKASMTSFIFPSVDYDAICLSMPGAISELKLNGEHSELGKEPICKFKGVITKAEVVRMKDGTLACYLAAGGGLYANERQLARNCTSFELTQSHIIFTTTNHLLKFIHLTSILDLEVPDDKPEIDERCRSIERGSKLVAVMPSASSLTLQMPRGNLETIYPRALVLASIRRNIEKKQYRKAFLTCRSQRVDMNIIYDYAPEQFLKNTETVIEQLKTVTYIDLFLAQLTDTDVSKNLYRETMPKSTSPNGVMMNGIEDQEQGVESPGKVNRICDAFLAILKNRLETNLQNVITANTCKIPPNIEAGLEVVAELAKKDETSAESALEHMCFLTDVNMVYDRALGMYDLDLTLMVAQQSQKDPREYLPYLQTLRNMELLRRKFSIDNDLKRYKSALSHLQTMNAFEELQAYTQKHELYQDALELYRYSQAEWRILLRLYADFLHSRNRYKEAAIAYESLCLYQLSMNSYQQDPTQWQSTLTTAALIPLSQQDLQSLAENLKSSLLEQKDFMSAATIAHEHLNDIPSTITHLTSAYKPKEAFRIATTATATEGHTSLLTSTLDPALGTAAGDLLELISDCKAQCVAQTNRLKEVREIKLKDPLRYFGETPQGFSSTGGGAGDGVLDDTLSLAGTESSISPSLFTRYGGASSVGMSTLQSSASRKTSKNRRREERKRARGKKGSVYEEEYLVSSIERLIERIESARLDVKEVVEVLLRRGMWERARALEESCMDVVEMVRVAAAWVFGSSAGRGAGGLGVGKGGEVGALGVGVSGREGGGSGAVGPSDGERPMGGEGVLWDFMQTEQGNLQRTKPPPVVLPYERSALLS